MLMRSGLQSTNTNVSIFSPDTVAHTQATDDILFNTSYTFPAGSTTLQQEEDAWYRNPCEAERTIADTN